MKTLYCFKSDTALQTFMFGERYSDHNPEMGKVLQKAGTFSLVASEGSTGYNALKNGVKLRTNTENVYITRNEMLQFFKEVEPTETEIDRFDKAVKLVSAVVDIDNRTAAFIKLVRFELSNQG